MRIYTYSQARQGLATLLDEAQREGAVGIRRKDGSTFVLSPDRSARSPLDVPGIGLGISTEEVIGFVHEGRRKAGRMERP